MEIRTNPENPAYGLVFTFDTPHTDDPEANSARWAQVERWIEAHLPDNRMKGGVLNGRHAYVTLRFSR